MNAMNAMDVPAGVLPPEASTPDEMYRFAADSAVQAPSVHNSQPWWFSHDGQEIGLHADAERRLAIADPAGREMLISCGAALFNLRIALRALGWQPDVKVLPDPELRNLVAWVSWREQSPASEYELRLFAEVARRRTHRGGFEDRPVPQDLLTALAQEAASEGAELRLMTGDEQRSALAAVVEAGDYALRRDDKRAREQARWAPAPRNRRRDGVPATAYPAQPERTTPYFPGREFAHGHGWGLPPQAAPQHASSAGTAALLVTRADTPAAWIAAGQALQRVLLLASSCGVAAAMHSQPLEIPALRDFTSEQFGAGEHAQMVLRFGMTDRAESSIRMPIDTVRL
jgi:hypothetical protein